MASFICCSSSLLFDFFRRFVLFCPFLLLDKISEVVVGKSTSEFPLSEESVELISVTPIPPDIVGLNAFELHFLEQTERVRTSLPSEKKTMVAKTSSL